MTRAEFDEKIKSLQNDPEALNQLQNAPTAETLSKLLNERGIVISADELASIDSEEETELDTEGMENVTGGGVLTLLTIIKVGGDLIKGSLDLAPDGKYGKQVQSVFNKVYNFVTGR